MLGFTSSFSGIALKSAPHGTSVQPRCAVESSASSEQAVRGPEVWKTGKVRASRPIRGIRRAEQGNVRIQGTRRTPNELRRLPPGVRVTAGTARGRRLLSPHVYLRPMMGKVREAVFSMLVMMDALRNDGCILDLFAGSGSVGLEAMSRGVRNGVFVDSAPECIAAVNENAKRCGFSDRMQAMCSRVETFLGSALEYNGGQPYSLITVTPPYEEVDYSELLTAVAESDCVGEGTFVVVEYPVELKCLPPSISQRLIGVRNRRYGRTVIAIYACQPRIDVELRPEEFIFSDKR